MGAPGASRSNQSNRLDRIATPSLEIDDHKIHVRAGCRGNRGLAAAYERDSGARRLRDRSDFRTEEQVVHDRDDHDKIIPDMLIRTAAVPPFYKNGYLVACERTRAGVLIDPGDEVDSLLDTAYRERIDVTKILLTHAHLDHVTGVGVAKQRLGVDVWLHKDDQFLYDGLAEQGMMFGLRVERQPPIDHFYEPGRAIAFGDLVADVLHTPGHCPGGVCLAIGPAGETTRDLFVGDTLFAGSIGRTDLPGGDSETLLRSIREVLFSFPDDTAVYSGHGPATTIGEERRTNPFLS
jgi:hydroxyacylglutathione hydrolase